jgi:hypothetical protein
MENSKMPLLFWGKTIGIGLLSLFFLAMGVDTLISAYRLTHPIHFLALFFSSNLMILISVVGCLYSILKIRGHINSGFKSL